MKPSQNNEKKFFIIIDNLCDIILYYGIVNTLLLLKFLIQKNINLISVFHEDVCEDSTLKHIEPLCDGIIRVVKFDKEVYTCKTVTKREKSKLMVFEEYFQVDEKRNYHEVDKIEDADESEGEEEDSEEDNILNENFEV